MSESGSTNRGVKKWSKVIGLVCSHKAITFSFSESGTLCTGDMYFCGIGYKVCVRAGVC